MISKQIDFFATLLGLKVFLTHLLEELNTATRTLNYKKRKMDESTISECNLTMLATQSFNHILDQIQNFPIVI